MSSHQLRRALVLTTGFMFMVCLVAWQSNVSAQTGVSGEDDYLVINAASAENGATVAYASSAYSMNFPPAAIINGDRRGTGWGAGTGGWNDGTLNAYPDTVEIQFAREMSISEVAIVTLQDNYTNPVEPTLSTTFSLYGIRDFNVWYRGADGQWYLLWNVTGNNKVLRSFKFSPVMTSRIKVEVLGSAQNYTRLVEVEAWGNTGIELVTEPAEPAPGETAICEGDKMDPCELSRNLLSAMQGTGPLPYGNHVTPTSSPYYRTTSWKGQLNWNFGNWQNFGSLNKAQLAHAITLWRTPSQYGKTDDIPALNWWITYFDCQLGNGCTTSKVDNTPLPANLRYWNWAELFSNTYDAESISAVVATHVWAAKEYASIPDSTRRSTVKNVLDKSRAYLLTTWRLYALGAGRGSAWTQLNRYNHGDPPNGWDIPKQQKCQSNYNGPFMPLAGMRSTVQHTCGTDDRGPMLAKALEWSHTGTKGTNHIRDLMTQAQTVKAEANALPDALYKAENAYATTPTLRAMLRRHIDGRQLSGEDTTGAIVSNLQHVRTGVEYHFVGARVYGSAGNEARLTLMRDNLTTETAAMFGITYDYPRRVARMLFPWPGRGVTDPNCPVTTGRNKPWRSTVKKGYADFLPNENSPAAVYGSSKDRDGTSSCKNFENGESVTEQFSLPQDWQLFYHVKFSPSGAPIRKL